MYNLDAVLDVGPLLAALPCRNVITVSLLSLVGYDEIFYEVLADYSAFWFAFACRSEVPRILGCIRNSI